ncbi:FBD-associated F-box protein [Striga hermonthica]|uniref:FBD-associated F-box protein n=1 Tax=Striga hermonthica TaxID=68872 RepID=A0A9N7MUG2_STRHE|nr:FBD-associated F-box protein [Striga hermonthica]
MNAKKVKVGTGKKIDDDLLSSLPDDMLHHIMSLLPARSAASTSILSQRWEKLWLSFPSINLDEINFASRQEFWDCLRSTLANRDLSALQNLCLRIILPGTARFYQDFCKFLNTVLVKSKILKELDIEFSEHLFFVWRQEDLLSERICVLPKKTFHSISHLSVLSLKGCRVKSCPHVNLPSLKTLLMENVILAEEFLEALVNGCPVLDTMSVKYCFGIKKIQICHPTLKNLVIGLRISLESLELNVPCLKSIKLFALVDSEIDGLEEILGPNNSKKIIARNLEALCFKHLTIEPKVLHNVILIFPNLGKLAVKFCEVLDSARLHSQNLTILKITDCVLSDEVDIRVPNLQNIDYLQNPKGAQLDYMAFMHLRSISLDGIYVNFRVIYISNSICPNLVYLRLAFCMNMTQLRVSNDKLESLEVYECGDLECCLIVAPQLLAFSYTGHLVRVARFRASCNLNVMLHLNESEGDDELVEAQFIKVLKESLHNVSMAAARTDIKLSYRCAKSLTMIKDVPIPPMSLIQSLKVVTHTGVMGLQDLLSCSLGISIYCNTISINVSRFMCTLEFQEIKKSSLVHKSNLTRVEDHLVRVEMKGFTGDDEQVDLVKYFVVNAPHMRHLVIWMKRQETRELCNELCRQLLHISGSCDIATHGNYVVFSRNEI